jgi:hypothetical protein
MRNPFTKNYFGVSDFDTWLDQTIVEPVRSIFLGPISPTWSHNPEREARNRERLRRYFANTDIEDDDGISWPPGSAFAPVQKPSSSAFNEDDEDEEFSSRPSYAPEDDYSPSVRKPIKRNAETHPPYAPGATSYTQWPTPKAEQPSSNPAEYQMNTNYAPDGPVNSRLREDYLDRNGRGGEASIEHTLRDRSEYNERMERERIAREQRERQERDAQLREEGRRREQAARERQDQARREQEEANRRRQDEERSRQQAEDRRRQEDERNRREQEDRRRQEEDRRRNSGSGW